MERNIEKLCATNAMQSPHNAITVPLSFLLLRQQQQQQQPFLTIKIALVRQLLRSKRWGCQEKEEESEKAPTAQSETSETVE